jgi:hypothetical protein
MGAVIREPNTYWLLTWLESQRIRNLEQAKIFRGTHGVAAAMLYACTAGLPRAAIDHRLYDDWGWRLVTTLCDPGGSIRNGFCHGDRIRESLSEGYCLRRKAVPAPCGVLSQAPYVPVKLWLWPGRFREASLLRRPRRLLLGRNLIDNLPLFRPVCRAVQAIVQRGQLHMRLQPLRIALH